MAFDFLVIGCVGIDTNVYFYGDGPNFELEGNFTENIDYIGQAGGYASRLAKSLGHSVSLIAPVGPDYSGDFIRKSLSEDGINTDGLFLDPMGTNRSINFMYPDGRRKNFYDGKDNFNLKVDPNAFRTLVKGSKVAHLNIANWCRDLIPLLKEEDVYISTDLQDVVDFDDEYRHDFIDGADIIFFSLVNFQGREERVLNQLIRKYPTKKFVAGNGSKGCWVAFDGKAIRLSPVNKEVTVVDTNGAGDSLAIGTLKAYLFDQKSLIDAANFGQKIAQNTCTIKASTDLSSLKLKE